MNLHQSALTILLTSDIDAKLAQTKALAQAYRVGDYTRSPLPPKRLTVIGRPEKPALVAPKDLARRRSLKSERGRAILIHALAHIEFNAIHLALDAVYRFQQMPEAFYADWLRVAKEEAEHFALLAGHLATLGYAYGDFPAHNGLWEMAVDTDDDPLVRMALVPRLLEARGLDVAPGIAEQLKAVGDLEAARILDIIINDEITHVHIGNHWYHWLCKARDIDAFETFQTLLNTRAQNMLKGPLALELRAKAGFSAKELDFLLKSIEEKAKS